MLCCVDWELPTFRDNIRGASSGDKQSEKNDLNVGNWIPIYAQKDLKTWRKHQIIGMMQRDIEVLWGTNAVPGNFVHRKYHINSSGLGTLSVKKKQLMFGTEIIAVCSEIRTKHVNTLCGSWWGNLRERDSLEDQVVDGKIILIWILRKWEVRSTNWIELAHDRDSWRALVNAVMNLRGSIKCVEFLD